MSELLGQSPTRVQTHESPSLRQAECRVQPPATGLRLPPLRGESETLRVQPGLSAGGEHAQRTASDGQGASDARAGASPEAAPLSLSQKEQCGNEPADDVGWRLRDDPCPLGGYLAVDRTTGEVAWEATCKNARCERCSRRVSSRTFALARRAMRDEDRGRFITLTQVAEGWQEARAEVYELAKAVRRQGWRTEWLWVLERGDQTGMKHAHLIQHGDFIPFEWLKGQWGRRVEIQAARESVDGYLAKNVVRYLGKGLDSDRSAIEAHMNLNGGRAAHWSRGFFAGVSRRAFAQAHPLPGIYFLRNEWNGATA